MSEEKIKSCPTCKKGYEFRFCSDSFHINPANAPIKEENELPKEDSGDKPVFGNMNVVAHGPAKPLHAVDANKEAERYVPVDMNALYKLLPTDIVEIAKAFAKHNSDTDIQTAHALGILKGRQQSHTLKSIVPKVLDVIKYRIASYLDSSSTDEEKGFQTGIGCALSTFVGLEADIINHIKELKK